MAAVLAVQAVAAALAFLLIAGGRDGGLPSLTPIAEAAERTAQYSGARMQITGRYDEAGSDRVLTVHGEGEFNGNTGRSRVTVAVDLPPKAVWRYPEGFFDVEEVAEESPGTFVAYQRSPSFGRLPEGADWVKLDFSEDVDVPSASLDPRQQLRMLRTSYGLENLGTETVRGVRTTRYRAMIDAGEEVERLRQEGKDRQADFLETVIAANDGADTSEVEAWVGPDQTIYRYRMTMPFSITGPAGSTLQVTVDLSEFGIEPDIALPDDSQAFDATQLARDELDRLAE